MQQNNTYSALGRVYALLIELAEQAEQTNAGNEATRQDDTFPANTEQPEAARQTDCTTPGRTVARGDDR